jgi:hypothetical protein
MRKKAVNDDTKSTSRVSSSDSSRVVTRQSKQATNHVESAKSEHLEVSEPVRKRSRVATESASSSTRSAVNLVVTAAASTLKRRRTLASYGDAKQTASLSVNEESCDSVAKSATSSQRLRKNRHKFPAYVDTHDESSNNSMASSSTKSSVASSASSTNYHQPASESSSNQNTSVFNRLASFLNKQFDWPYLSPSKEKKPDHNKAANSPTENNTDQKEEHIKEEKKESRSKNVIIVPNWRIVTIKKGFRLEGTENMNDDCFLKRHQKHENEEIRIKRRDMRWQREEYLREKLLKGRSSSFASVGDSANGSSKTQNSKNGKSKTGKMGSSATGSTCGDSEMSEDQIYKREFNESMVDGEFLFYIYYDKIRNV